MFQNEVIDRYMHCMMQNVKKYAQVCIYSLEYLNIGHCVELVVLEGKLGRIRMLAFLNWGYKTYGILKVKVDSTQMRNVFSS